jgi:hypothetical protein
MTDQVVMFEEDDDKEILNLKEGIERIRTENDLLFKEKEGIWKRLFATDEKIYPPEFVDVVDAYERNYEEARLKYGRIRDQIRVQQRKHAEMTKKYDELSTMVDDLKAKFYEYDDKLVQKEKEKLKNAFIRKYSDWNSADLTKHAKELNQSILFADGYREEYVLQDRKTELEVITQVLIEQHNIYVEYDADNEISFIHGEVPKRRKY